MSGRVSLLAAAGLFVVGVVGFLLVGHPTADWISAPLASPAAPTMNVQRLNSRTVTPRADILKGATPGATVTPSPAGESVLAAGDGQISPVEQLPSPTASPTPTEPPPTPTPAATEARPAPTVLSFEELLSMLFPSATSTPAASGTAATASPTVSPTATPSPDPTKTHGKGETATPSPTPSPSKTPDPSRTPETPTQQACAAYLQAVSNGQAEIDPMHVISCKTQLGLPVN